MNADLQSLVVILVAAALAPLVVDLPSRFRLPAVVAEITLGILVGPQVLGFAEAEGVVEFLSTVGLAFLFFLGGLEVDFDRIRGLPAKLGGLGWLVSLALGLTAAFALEEIGFVLSTELIGIALCTTAVGTLIPILRDAGELKSPLGPFVLAAGVAGEFGPLVVVALLLTSGREPGVAFALLLAFVIISVLTAVVATRARTPRIVAVIHDAMASSGQAAVRLALVVLFGLVFLASEFGFDIVLGAFAAGLVVGLVTKGEKTEDLRMRLETIGFGFVIPVFFIVTGMEFDLAALFDSPTNLLRLPAFLALFLVIRGLPVFLLYRTAIPKADRVPLALYSATALPLVVAITTIGLETGHMRPDNAAALVGAAMVSVLLFPFSALILRRRERAAERSFTPSA